MQQSLMGKFTLIPSKFTLVQVRSRIVNVVYYATEPNTANEGMKAVSSTTLSEI